MEEVEAESAGPMRTLESAEAVCQQLLQRLETAIFRANGGSLVAWRGLLETIDESKKEDIDGNVSLIQWLNRQTDLKTKLLKVSSSSNSRSSSSNSSPVIVADILQNTQYIKAEKIQNNNNNNNDGSSLSLATVGSLLYECGETVSLGNPLGRRVKRGFACTLNKPNVHFSAHSVIAENSAEAKEYMWMDSEAKDVSDQQNRRLEKLSDSMCNEYADEWKRQLISSEEQTNNEVVGADKQEVTTPVGTVSSTCVVVSGRVECETEGTMTEQAVLLEGSRKGCNGRRTQLWLTNVPQLCLFPGQVISAIGTCEDGDEMTRFCAKRLYSGLRVEPPTVPLSFYQTATQKYNNLPIQIAVVVGPYKNKGAQGFKAFELLLDTWRIDKPHVILLLGPFVDVRLRSNEQRSADTATDWEDADEIYDTIFSKIYSLAAKLQETKFVIVPSTFELAHLFPLPQPPFSAYERRFSQQSDNAKQPQVFFISNPGILRINELKLSITSADVLAPIVESLVCRGPGAKKRTEKVCLEMLRQRSLFPSLLTNHPTDPKRYSCLHYPLDELPDIMIFNSSVEPKPFVKEVSSYMFVNCCDSFCVSTTAADNKDDGRRGGFLNLFINPPAPESSSTTRAESSPTLLKVPQRLIAEVVQLVSSKVKDEEQLRSDSK